MSLELGVLILNKGRPHFEAVADNQPIIILIDTSAIMALTGGGKVDVYGSTLERQRDRIHAAAQRLWSDGFTTEAEGSPALLVTALDL